MSAIVVNRRWWEALPADVQHGYQKRCTERCIELRVDDRLSRHVVEVIGGPDQSSPSTERRV